MTTTKDSLMATTHADAAEMPDTLDPDVVGVWVWFPGDDLAGDPAADAWDLYSREGYELGFGGGGCAGADPQASVTDLLEVSIRNLDLSDAAFQLEPRLWGFRLDSEPQDAPWRDAPAYLVRVSQ